jgi:hypothetical protein
MTVFDMLNLRFNWEELVKDYKLEEPRKQGTIDNLKYFLEHGLVGNRFRSGYDDAVKIAQNIVDEYDRSLALLERRLAR